MPIEDVARQYMAVESPVSTDSESEDEDGSSYTDPIGDKPRFEHESSYDGEDSDCTFVRNAPNMRPITVEELQRISESRGSTRHVY